MMRKYSISVVLIVALFAVGCGDDDSSSSNNNGSNGDTMQPDAMTDATDDDAMQSDATQNNGDTMTGDSTNGDSMNGDTMSNEDSMTSDTTDGSSKYTIEVSDQTLDNPSTVTIDSISLGSKDAWIIIHEQNDSQDGPGAIIGQTDSPISADTNTNDVTVSLTRDASDGEILYAMFHYEDPDDGDFTFGDNAEQDPPVMRDGAPVMDSFEVTVE